MKQYFQNEVIKSEEALEVIPKGQIAYQAGVNLHTDTLTTLL